MDEIRIFHVIQELSSGGAGRSLLALAKYSARLGAFQHTVSPLLPPDQKAIKMAQAAGIRIGERQEPALRQEMESSDIVHLHFWNTPELYRWLHTDLPAMRLLNWIKIAGDHAPQVITEELLDFADCSVLCCPYSWELPLIQSRLPARQRIEHGKVDLVHSGADWERVAGHTPQAHSGFNVGYVGQVDFAKMHPNYVQLHAHLDIPELRVVVCGGGDAYPMLKRQAQELGVSERFDFLGYVESIGSLFERLDLFGYPLCEETYAAAELALQEAMVMGVPPVVLAHGSPARTIRHGQTGFVAATAGEYKQALEFLYHHPEERKRLGENAQHYARAEWGAEQAAHKMNAIYRRLLDQPKRQHTWPGPSAELWHGAAQFVRSLGDYAPQFRRSMSAKSGDELLDAEQTIARSAPVLCSAGGGGILHYRRAYPDDPYLRLWAGLVFLQQGRHALAAAEFTQAIKQGLHHWRLYWYMAQAAAQSGGSALAATMIGKVLEEQPHFAPALQMLKSTKSSKL